MDEAAKPGMRRGESEVAELEARLFEIDAAGGNCKPVIASLIEIDTDSSWDALGRFLGERCSAAVSFTIADLEELVRPGAARALGAALANREPNIRRSAVLALARQETGLSLASLLRGCRDPDAEVARTARAIVERRGDDAPERFEGVAERVMDGVFDFLGVRSPFDMIVEEYPEGVRAAAALRIGAVGDAEATGILAQRLVTAEGRFAEACWEGLEQCEAVSTPLLLPLLAQPDPETVIRALGMLILRAGPEDGDLLAAMSRAREHRVRAVAVQGLARARGGEALETLCVSLGDAEPVRRTVIDLLGDIPESTEKLLAAIDHRDPEIRKRAMTHLANRGVITDELMPRYFEFLETGCRCTDQSDPRYMESLARIARVLGEGGHPEGLMALARLASSPLRRLRRMAVEAILGYAPDVRADALHDLAGTHDREVLKHVALGLAEAGDPRATIPMIRASRECRGLVAKRAARHLAALPELDDCDTLMRLLTERFPSVRRFAAERLLTIQDPRAVPALIQASRDEEVEVQLAVFEALAPFASEVAEVRERMLEAVGSGDVSVRQQACEALGEARCREAVPMLVKALSNTFLRPRAREALRRIGDRMGMLAIRRIERREKLFRNKRPSRTARPRRRAIAV